MTSTLNIRDIGDARKGAITAEARARGLSVADLVREWIDNGLDDARRTREREAWVRAAAPGLAAEQSYLDTHGPTLARYRRRGTGGDAAPEDAG